MTEYETAALLIAAAHVVVGLMQVAIVAYGIRAMRTMSERRTREQDQRHAEADQRHAEAGQRHAEAMRALEALIERTGGAR